MGVGVGGWGGGHLAATLKMILNARHINGRLIGLRLLLPARSEDGVEGWR